MDDNVEAVYPGMFNFGILAIWNGMDILQELGGSFEINIDGTGCFHLAFKRHNLDANVLQNGHKIKKFCR